MKYRCECGKSFDASRGLDLHFVAGCPGNLLEMWMSGYTLKELSRFNLKTQARIRTLIRREGIRRKVPEEELP